jgi:hypothetical protein
MYIGKQLKKKENETRLYSSTPQDITSFPTGVFSLPHRFSYPIPGRSLPLKYYLTVYSVIKKILVSIVILKILLYLQ